MDEDLNQELTRQAKEIAELKNALLLLQAQSQVSSGLPGPPPLPRAQPPHLHHELFPQPAFFPGGYPTAPYFLPSSTPSLFSPDQQQLQLAGLAALLLNNNNSFISNNNQTDGTKLPLSSSSSSSLLMGSEAPYSHPKSSDAKPLNPHNLNILNRSFAGPPELRIPQVGFNETNPLHYLAQAVEEETTSPLVLVRPIPLSSRFDNQPDHVSRHSEKKKKKKKSKNTSASFSSPNSVFAHSHVQPETTARTPPTQNLVTEISEEGAFRQNESSVDDRHDSDHDRVKPPLHAHGKHLANAADYAPLLEEKMGQPSQTSASPLPHGASQIPRSGKKAKIRTESNSPPQNESTHGSSSDDQVTTNSEPGKKGLPSTAPVFQDGRRSLDSSSLSHSTLSTMNKRDSQALTTTTSSSTQNDPSSSSPDDLQGDDSQLSDPADTTKEGDKAPPKEKKYKSRPFTGLTFDPSGLSVDDLKEELRQRGLSSNGPKQILLERLYTAINANPMLSREQLSLRDRVLPRGSKREPRRDEFHSEEAFQVAWERWREIRKNNNDSVKRSRQNARERHAEHVQKCQELEDENRRLARLLSKLKGDCGLLSKAVRSPRNVDESVTRRIKRLMQGLNGSSGSSSSSSFSDYHGDHSPPPLPLLDAEAVELDDGDS